MRGSVPQPPSAKAARAKAARAKPQAWARTACTLPRPADVTSKPPGDMLITPHKLRTGVENATRLAVSQKFTPPIRPSLLPWVVARSDRIYQSAKPSPGNHHHVRDRKSSRPPGESKGPR